MDDELIFAYPYLGVVQVVMTIIWPKSRYARQTFDEFVEYAPSSASPVRHFVTLKKSRISRQRDVVAVVIDLAKKVPNWYEERLQAAAKLLVEWGFTDKSEAEIAAFLRQSETAVIVVENYDYQ
jgi:hypothetical protein